MKILPFTSAGWLFFCCTIYVIVSIYNIFYTFTLSEYIQAVWIFITGLPLFIKMSWLVKVKTVWELRNGRTN